MYRDDQDYFLRKEWEAQEKQDHYRVAAGVMNFLGVVLGVVSILVLAALLFSLLSWLRQDIASNFTIRICRLGIMTHISSPLNNLGFLIKMVQPFLVEQHFPPEYIVLVVCQKTHGYQEMFGFLPPLLLLAFYLVLDE